MVSRKTPAFSNAAIAFSAVGLVVRSNRVAFVCVIIGCVGSGIFGILRMFSSSYAQFATFEFLDSFVGAATYSTSYIIGLELVTPRYRTLFGTLLNCFYAFGEIYLGFIAMWFRNYKTILAIVYAPAFLVIFYIFFLPQSKF